MKIKYADIYNLDSSARIPVEFDETEHCPICKHAIRPIKFYGKIFKTNSDEIKLAVMYSCNHCYYSFIAQYSDCFVESKTGLRTFSVLDFLSPNMYEKTLFEDCISNVSPMFIRIYNQASEAEHHNLDEIAGIGYRKALEFLIKDFLIHQFPDKEDSIKATSLGTCIENFIENPQLKTVASRAVWLGNDQTHYIQKFEDKDIEDLKRLIKLTINWITMLYLTAEAEEIKKP